MNAIFSLSLVIFVTFIVPIPMGITVVSVPITTVLPLTFSLFPQYYCNFRPHYRSFTAVIADLPLPPSTCSSSPGGYHLMLYTFESSCWATVTPRLTCNAATYRFCDIFSQNLGFQGPLWIPLGRLCVRNQYLPSWIISRWSVSPSARYL